MEINGKKVLIPVNVNQSGYANKNEYDSNKLTTVHGDVDAVQRLANALNEHSEENIAVFYINKDKATKVLQRTGNPIPSGLSNLDGFIHSVIDPGSPVKMRITSVTESKQFKDWFGNWQKHPEHASKVVNADGTPRVMYHGTGATFTVFDKRKARLGAFGKGFYFAPSESRAKAYGSAQIMEVYLNVGRATNDKTYHIYDITKKIRDTADRINGLERPKETEGNALESGIYNNRVYAILSKMSTMNLQMLQKCRTNCRRAIERVAMRKASGKAGIFCT